MKKMPQKTKPDLFAQESPLAFLGGYEARLENDPDFGAKVYSAIFLVAGIIGLIGTAFFVVEKDKPAGYIISGGALLMAVFIYFFYPAYKRYDIASTRQYCVTLYPRGSEKVIRECIIERQREERLRSRNNQTNTLAFF
jgi:hypothetical protein